jgi:predicted metalloprotease with PDZ domain
MMEVSDMVENHQPAPFHPLSGAIQYIVRFPEPRTHYVSVEARIPVPVQNEAEVFMAVWTPGSYLIREYARHVEGVVVTAANGNPLSFHKSRKNRWLIQTGASDEIRFSYRVYCREMSVRTNWVEESFALLNSAPTFVSLVGGSSLPHHVKLELPANWKISVTGMQGAVDYDTLVDSPILAGNPAIYQFEVAGVAHYLVNEGEAGVWDGPRSAADLEKIVRYCASMWGAIPCDRYYFLNLLMESGGGLEHCNSVCMIASRWATRTRSAYLKWLALAAHEYFHMWNVKRLRPVELGPFDYENENPTRSLWIAEGFTEYYTGLILRRAGLVTAQEYLETVLSELISTLQSTPGRLWHSAREASWDAWIKLYRPDENTKNTSISYYTKGAVIGWLLDARIRCETEGAKSLDDLMRLAFQRFSGEHGFTPEQFESTAEEIAGASLRSFFSQTVESAEELDYSEALDWFGLRFCATEERKPGLGVETKLDTGRLVISRIPRDGPAWDSGLSVDDEIIAINDFRVRADQLTQRLESYRAGDSVSLLVSRRDLLMRIELTLARTPSKLHVEILPDASALQNRHREDWLAVRI